MSSLFIFRYWPFLRAKARGSLVLNQIYTAGIDTDVSSENLLIFPSHSIIFSSIHSLYLSTMPPNIMYYSLYVKFIFLMQYSDHSIYVHVYWSSNPRTLGRMSHGGGGVETKKCRYGAKSISANWINGLNWKNHDGDDIHQNTWCHDPNEFH